MLKLKVTVVFLVLFGSGDAFHHRNIGSRHRWIQSHLSVSESDVAQSNSNEQYHVSGYRMSTDGKYQNSLKEKGTLVKKLFGPRPLDADEDGYQQMRAKEESFHWTKPLRRVKNFLFRNPPVEPGTLILLRHGESTWNANATFTGWADPGLSERGRREIEHAARLLLEGGYEIDLVFSSRLKRAINSAWIILDEMDMIYKPVFKTWRLNERMYGALTGLCKFETAEKLGADLVQEWRGSLRTRPPALTSNDEYWPGRDRRYADLPADKIPLTESLMDCMERTAPVWEERIKYELRHGRNVMVVAHANTLRGLVKTIDGISDEDIQQVSIPTAIPIVYKFSQELKPIPPKSEERAVSQIHMSGLFLEKPGLLKEALKREQEWANKVPGYNENLERRSMPSTSLERSLFKLRAERELEEWAGQFVDPDADMEDDGSDGNNGQGMQFVEDEVWEKGLNSLGAAQQAQKDLLEIEPEEVVPTMISSSPCVTSVPSEVIVPGIGSAKIRRDPVIVIIRHGKTGHNKLGLFTGWDDVPLAEDGIEEAKAAGQLLKRYGFEFDVVYTSWLSRAIETAWLVIEQMDDLWLPMIKSWRLNERMYGELSGLSKRMVKQRHGEKQFKAWRRGYKTPPPKVSSFSPHYPGNDSRYSKYLKDLPYSVRESLIRSIEKGKPTLARKLPKSESLKDCMDRTIPFFTECIVPEAIDQGKRVLISSSENAIRGLLMHLCDIPEEKIVELEIPNGLPIIFDVKSKCVKLLDDGTGRDPLEVHNFGNAASYLFRPCLNEDGSPDEECMITADIVEISEEDQAVIDSIRRPSMV